VVSTFFEPINPHWSPDGTRFVFSAFHPDRREAGFDIFVANADGTGLARLTDGPSFERWPFWSADGETIYYEAAPGPAGGVALAAVPAAGGASRWLLDNADDNGLIARDPGTGELFFTRLPVTNRYVTVDIGEILDRAGGGLIVTP
jgi:Tol biopolymer transport system component